MYKEGNGKEDGAECYILTGGPGSGKSTLLNALGAYGYCCYEEVSRLLIREQAALDKGIMPWNDLPAFAELVIEAMIKQYRMSQEVGGICFFDRAVPDVFGYLKNSGLAVPPKYLDLLGECRYKKEVFMFPPWPAIFVQDDERPQTYEESVSLYHALFETYEEYGFMVYEVPEGSVQERVTYIQSKVGQQQGVIK